MKRLKHKILIPTIAAISTIAVVAPLCVSISSNISSSSLKSSTLNAITYKKIHFNADKDIAIKPEWTVTLSGQTLVKAEEGDKFVSIPKPTPVHSLNWKFKGWSTERQNASLIIDPTTAPTYPGSGALELWPIFEAPALLSNCLCISAIEKVKVTVHFSTDRPTTNAAIDMWYSMDFGATWKQITHTGAQDVELPTLQEGGTLYLKGNNPDGLSFGSNANQYTHFSFTSPSGSTANCKVNIFGNAMGLVNNGSREDQKYKQVPCDYCFYKLFAGTTDAPNKAIEYVADNFFPCEGNPKSTVSDQHKILKRHCYESAFEYCTEMVHAPRLFATTEAVNGEGTSYENTSYMCYASIFRGCSKVDFVRTRFDGTPVGSTKQFAEWVNGVSSTGKFIYNGTASKTDFGFEAGWDIEKTPDDGSSGIEITPARSDNRYTADEEYEFSAIVSKDGSSAGVCQDVYWMSSDETICGVEHTTGKIIGRPTTTEKSVFLTCVSAANLNANKTIKITVVPVEQANVTVLTNDSNQAATFAWTYVGSAPTAGFPNFKYSLDGGASWHDTVMDTSVSIPAGGTLLLKGDNPDGLAKGDDALSYTQFKITGGPIKLSGTVKGLINNGVPGSNTDKIPCNYCFSHLFANTNISKVSLGYLPYTYDTSASTEKGQLTKGCYSYMFSGCSNLQYIGETTTASEVDFLPATQLKDKDGNDCDDCYSHMFYGCSSLVHVPKLPATEIAAGCYDSMYYGCSEITIAPELPATCSSGGKDKCYHMLFQDCEAITTIKPMALTKLGNRSCLQTYCFEWAYNNVYTSYSGTIIFTCPDTTGLTEPTEYMFYNTKLSKQHTPVKGEVYRLKN